MECSSCGVKTIKWHTHRKVCKECYSKQQKKYRDANKDRIREQKKKYREHEKEKSNKGRDENKQFQCKVCKLTKSGAEFRGDRHVCRACECEKVKLKRKDNTEIIKTDKEKKQRKTNQDKPRCQYEIKTGVNKGKKCIRKARIQTYCKTHYNYLLKFKKDKEDCSSELQSKNCNIVKVNENKITLNSERSGEDKLENYNILNQIISYNDCNVRILGTYEQPWFVAKDIAQILGYSKTDQAIRKHVDEEDKKKLKFFGPLDSRGQPEIELDIKTVLINESGLYSLILRSKLTKAKEFKRWVTSEVLPNLRKQGYHKLSEEKHAEFDALNNKLQQVEEENIKYLALNGYLEEQNEEQTTEIKSLVRSNRYFKKELNRYQKKHHYVQLNTKGPCYYIYHTKCFVTSCSGVKIKPGIGGIGDKGTLDDRLRGHRTLDGDMILDLVILSSESKIILLEQFMLEKHKNILVTNNHEVMASTIELEDVIQSAKDFIKCLCPVKTDYDFGSEELIKKYNEDIQNTLNPNFKIDSEFVPQE